MRREFADHLSVITQASVNGHSVCVKTARALFEQLREVRDTEPGADEEFASAAFTASSAVSNYADYRADKAAARLAVLIADWGRALDIDVQLRRNLEYNAATARTVVHQVSRSETQKDKFLEARLQDRELLRDARLLFTTVGYDNHVAGELRGRALCNLANTLDDSGRWVEAYQAYRDALDADSTNGNAAGNAAELIRRRISSGRGALGHYAVVHDELADLAVANRARTVEIAGEATAKRWDDAPRFGGEGHHEHVGDIAEPYQQWIKQHRFALTFAMEGLGTDTTQWDSAGIHALSTVEHGMPAIFTSVNVLKAEYLVSRRLAFSGEERVVATPFGQPADDPGLYIDTLDMSVYGEASSSLVLAQRSTLDLLDKVAVAVNEHFGIGDDSNAVTFRSFWTKGNPPTLRERLPQDTATWTPAVLSLAELALDAQDGGTYASAQALRHAGTHRLVNLSWDAPDQEPTGAHVRIGALELVGATHASLAVARAAFLYLLDLVADDEEQSADGGVPILAPTQH
ncbi:hypothetical protein KK092_09690 [Curtobacterium flaccumfaciens pv. flaccumfaciens]|uniref:LA2681 family HEPN domain-containing protein n=1 Tax=Curtobacterium flaccumfaciens TaxID=2035 RepID=UPI001BDEEC91|nr:LA2681 family HEPN domain-containing protein [Curtobacterium flaccumfaciens]MBT1669653.1 hypothetical protein [Curtobacterium flaccumfaciens pv. flaccumfaciens]